MVSWAQRLAPYESQVGITFHHEPEATATSRHGTDVEFIAAWRRFMEVTTDAGLDATRVWIMTDYSFSRPPSDRRQAIKWYPGDEWVDAIAADAYNWYRCRTGIDDDVDTLAEIIEPMRQFGLGHPNERLMLTEIGSVEDDPARVARPSSSPTCRTCSHNLDTSSSTPSHGSTSTVRTAERLRLAPR